jgi:hypothetical protein
MYAFLNRKLADRLNYRFHVDHFSHKLFLVAFALTMLFTFSYLETHVYILDMRVINVKLIGKFYLHVCFITCFWGTGYISYRLHLIFGWQIHVVGTCWLAK